MTEAKTYSLASKPDALHDLQITVTGKKAKSVLKDLSMDDLRSLRTILNRAVEPQCLNYDGFSRTVFDMMKEATKGSDVPSLMRLRYDAPSKEFAVTNGYILLVDRHESDVFDKSGSFDICALKPTAKTKSIPYNSLPWLDDQVEYPDYHKILERYDLNSKGYITVPYIISFNTLAVMKALTEKPELKKEFGLVNIGPHWEFYLQYKKEETFIPLFNGDKKLKPTQFNVGYLYQALLFLTEGESQFIRIKQHKKKPDISPVFFETDSRLAMIMPVRF